MGQDWYKNRYLQLMLLKKQFLASFLNLVLAVFKQMIFDLFVKSLVCFKPNLCLKIFSTTGKIEKSFRRNLDLKQYHLSSLAV